MSHFELLSFADIEELASRAARAVALRGRIARLPLFAFEAIFALKL